MQMERQIRISTNHMYSWHQSITKLAGPGYLHSKTLSKTLSSHPSLPWLNVIHANNPMCHDWLKTIIKNSPSL